MDHYLKDGLKNNGHNSEKKMNICARNYLTISNHENLFFRNGILRTYVFGKAYCGQYCSQYAFFLTKDYIPVFLIGVRGK